MSKKFFEAFIDKVLEFPFWVKEVLYIKLRDDFTDKKVSESDLHTPIEESYQLHIPLITFMGKKELEDRDHDEDEKVYRFLQGVAEGCSVAEITLRNFWTLQDTAKVNVYCIQKEYLNQPTSEKVLATALYMSGRIKMGDYYKRIGKISVDDINKALQRQKELTALGKNIPFAQILISMGLVTEDETKAIIYVKDESKKRFIFNSGMLGKSTTTDSQRIDINANGDGKDKSAAQLVILRQEIYDLQNKLNQIANIIKR